MSEDDRVEPQQKPVEEMSFEEAVAELEALAARMSRGEMTLRESVAAYERGCALEARCRAELEAASETIERLRRPAADE